MGQLSGSVQDLGEPVVQELLLALRCKPLVPFWGCWTGAMTTSLGDPISIDSGDTPGDYGSLRNNG